MHGFDRYLEGRGYKSFAFNSETGRLEETGSNSISSLGPIGLLYIHSSNEAMKLVDKGESIKGLDIKDCFILGLNEGGGSPTLISPRPKIKVKKTCGLVWWLEFEWRDISMALAFENESLEDIYNAAINQDVTFIYNVEVNDVNEANK